MVGARAKSILIWTIIQWAALTTRAMEGSNYTDAEALLAVKAGLGGPVQLRTWSNLTNVCTWMGIKCDDTLNRVVFLSLQNENRNPLTGTLSPFIGNLTELTFLDLSFNQISGPIPREIGRLVKLTKLYLGRNLFTGNIPAELGNLVLAEEVTLDRCQVSGSVPAELGKLTTVSKLDLSFNSFNAAIPKELGNLPSIKQMYFAAGKFTGEIPPELGLLPFIEKMDLSNNNFTGSVPLTFLNLTDTLSQLGIGNNRLSGYLPPQLSSIEAFSYTGQNGDGAFCSRKNAYPLIPVCPPGTPGVPPEGGTGESSEGPKLAPILGGVLGGGVFVAVAVALFIVYILPWAKQASFRRQTSRKASGRVVRYSLEELRAATGNWTLILGKGGFGPVYRGVMPDGTLVAIKRLKAESYQGKAEFQNEIELLSRVHHRCLVNLIGWCDEKNENILVYEYKSRGSLDMHLRPSDSTGPVLPWSTRMCIAVDVAEGLDYLHHGAEPPVIHRDVKSSNVLLDALYNGSVADFGLSRLNQTNDTHVSTNVKGTPGYMDPEYMLLSKLSTARGQTWYLSCWLTSEGIGQESGLLTGRLQGRRAVLPVHALSLSLSLSLCLSLCVCSDVYAYGVLLLELISGMKAFDTFRGTRKDSRENKSAKSRGGEPASNAEHSAKSASSAGSSTAKSAAGLDISAAMNAMDAEQHPLLSYYAMSYLEDESLTQDLTDPRLAGSFDKDELRTVARVAIACLQATAKERPTMREVLRMLPIRQTQWQRPSEIAERDAASTVSATASQSQDPSRPSDSHTAPSSTEQKTYTLFSKDWSGWMKHSWVKRSRASRSDQVP